MYKYSTQIAAGGEHSRNDINMTEKPHILNEEEVFMNGIPPPRSPPRFRAQRDKKADTNRNFHSPVKNQS